MLTNEQLYKEFEALHVSNKEFRDVVLTALAKLVTSNELAVSGRESFRQTVGISTLTPIVLDYRGRKHVYLFSANALTLTLEDMGTIPVAANTWVDISFRPGLYIYAQNQATTAYVTIVQSDETIASSASGGGGGGGTQYTDGQAPPANPIGNALVFDNSGAWLDVGMDAGLPVQALSLPSLPAGTNQIGHVLVDNTNPNGQAVMASSSPVVIASNQSNVPVLMTANQGYVTAFGSNAAALTANTDYSFKWGAGGTTQVNHVMIFNGSAINLNFDLDVATTLGSPVLLPNNYMFLDVQTLILHLQANGTPNVNGSTANNIVVRGWL